MKTPVNQLKQLAYADALRVRTPVHHYHNTQMSDASGNYTDFTNNDYLNLSTHPALIEAYTQAACEFGVGSRSSPHISGYSHYHETFEKNFALWQGREKALFFNSGYHANIGIYPALAHRNTVILSDKLVHASILDGILLSRAKHVRYRHHDLDHLCFYLEKYKGASTIIVTESLFSMEGDITPVQQLCELAYNYKALLCVDDAHGLGVLGNTGKGICEHFNLSKNDVPLLIQPLGKAMGGMGAMTSGSATLIECIEQQARSYRYSTALPASHAAAGIAAVLLLEQSVAPLTQLKANIAHFNFTAKTLSLNLINDELSPIRCILTKTNEKTLSVQAALKERGHFVAAIRPPTVPANAARLRLSLSASHTTQQISRLLNDLSEVLA